MNALSSSFVCTCVNGGEEQSLPWALVFDFLLFVLIAYVGSLKIKAIIAAYRLYFYQRAGSEGSCGSLGLLFNFLYGPTVSSAVL